jgi:hypothetical protein
MLKVIEENDAIEVTDGAEELGTPTKIIFSILGIAGITIFLHGLGYFLLIIYAVMLWSIWQPYRSTSYLFDRNTLKVYRVDTKKKQRRLRELAHFSELGKFRIIEVQESDSVDMDDIEVQESDSVDMDDTGDMSFSD